MSRVKMPHNNRMSSSTALKTNDIWSKTIGYDPYAANADAQSDQQSEAQKASLMLLARMSNLSGSESRGGCKRCGMLGHLSFQCRNAPLKQTAAGPADDSDDSSASSQASPPPALKEHKESEKERPRKRSREEKDDSGSEASASSRDRNKEKEKRSHKDHKKHKKHHKKESKKKSKHEKKSHERSR
eukprot:gene11084-12344_t